LSFPFKNILATTLPFGQVEQVERDYFNCGAGMDTITDYPKASGDSKTSDCKTSNELISPSSSFFSFLVVG
jgi:hypothetical protein